MSDIPSNREMRQTFFEVTGKPSAGRFSEYESFVDGWKACHAELVQIMRILHCIAEAPAPSMEQTVVVRGVCELADRVRKADERVRMLVDAIQKARKDMTLEQNFYSRPGQLLEHAINATPQQTAEQIERWHVEWMKNFKISDEMLNAGGEMFNRTLHSSADFKHHAACVFEAMCDAIPPLPKE